MRRKRKVVLPKEMLKENYYALAISIVTHVNASEALRCMGLTEGKVKP